MEKPPPSRWPAYARVPPFLPVPLRARADGWTAERQARFIGMLAETGSVSEAARAVGMSRMATYRLRRRLDAAAARGGWDW
jgi:molybdenum-dependent DNA-binding transcriptional regulator ModE